MSGAGLLGAALGFGASRANQYYRTFDEDRGRQFRRGGPVHGRRRRPPPARLRLVPNVRRASQGRARKTTQYRSKRSQNGHKKRIKIKRKMPMARAAPRMQKNILYPCTFKTTMFVGTPVHTVGADSDLQLGNMVYRLGPLSKDNAHSAFEIWRMTSLAKTSDGTGTTLTDLDVGTNHFLGTGTQADIISGANQSKCLQTATSVSNAVQTVPHYMKATGQIHRDFNPTAYVAGFNINLQFLSYRQTKQQLCLRLIRVSRQALEDIWGQTQPGSATKTLDLMCAAVNSQKHLDRNEFEVLYENKVILPGYAPGAAHPKEVRIKKFLPCSYIQTHAKKVYSHSLTEWGGELTPTSKRDNSAFNHVFCTYSVRPLQSEVMAYRTDQHAPGATTNQTLAITDAFEGASGSALRGANTSARFRVNGTLTTHWRAMAIKRLNA